MQKSKIPYLFHIGTQKAGSTYLYNLLSSHPDLALPKITEVHYFSSNLERGLDWYLGLFEGKGVRIDASPKYFMFGKTVAPRIKDYSQKYLGNKEPLFLLILRNPIDYLNSHFRMQLAQGFFEKRPDKYPKLTDNLIKFIKMYPEYLERAFYSKILENYWFKYFSAKQFKIIIFEDFVRNTQKVISEILDFWGLPQRELISPVVSKNKMPRYKFLLKIQSKIIRNKKLKEFLKKNKAFNYVYDRFLTQESNQKLSPEERRELKDIFARDVKMLEEFLGKRIDFWEDFR